MAAAERILIVGAGVGGLALAIGLARHGVTVDIIEQQEKITATGVGMILQGNTLRALDRLEILDEVIAGGFPYSRSLDLGPDGEPIGDRPILKLLGPDRPGTVGIPRRLLADIYARLAQEAGVSVRLGLTVAALDDRGSHVAVRFSDGTAGDYDIVVGADGVYSQVRTMVFGEHHQPHYTGQGVWRYLTERHPKVTSGSRVQGPGIPIGMIPLTDELMYVFAVENSPEPVRYPRHEYVQRMKEQLSGYGPFIDEIAQSIKSADDIDHRSLWVFLMKEPWYRGRVVLIGDAVHAMTPHMASGAGMAIEDAQVLTEELLRDIPIEQRLQAFFDRRYRRCSLIVEASIQIGAWQLERPGTDFSRESFMSEVRGALAEPI